MVMAEFSYKESIEKEIADIQVVLSELCKTKDILDGFLRGRNAYMDDIRNDLKIVSFIMQVEHMLITLDKMYSDKATLVKQLN